MTLRARNLPLTLCGSQRRSNLRGNPPQVFVTRAFLIHYVVVTAHYEIGWRGEPVAKQSLAGLPKNIAVSDSTLNVDPISRDSEYLREFSLVVRSDLRVTGRDHISGWRAISNETFFLQLLQKFWRSVLGQQYGRARILTKINFWRTQALSTTEGGNRSNIYGRRLSCISHRDGEVPGFFSYVYAYPCTFVSFHSAQSNIVGAISFVDQCSDHSSLNDRTICQSLHAVSFFLFRICFRLGRHSYVMCI